MNARYMLTDKKRPHAGNLSWEIRGEELTFSGTLVLGEINFAQKQIIDGLRHYKRDRLEILINRITKIDSAGAAFLQFLESDLNSRGIQVSLSGATSGLQEAIDTFTLPDTFKEPAPAETPLLARIGNRVYNFLKSDMWSFLYLVSDVFYWAIVDLFSTRQRKKGEFFNQGTLIGANAVPIIGLLAFLIGLVIALQSAAQLRQFGANIFVVDLIGVSMTREMGPLLTAIIVAGRSGSAIASEIATMKVTEELDALKTMALNPIRYVVVPKLYAILVSLPLLTIIANIMGMVGGMVIAYTYLDINPQVFYSRLESNLYFWDLFTGFIKSLVFAGIIVLTASYYGFKVKGGSEGVGRATTASVVASIFLVILADSLLGLLFYFE